jgi:hypothetical protein
MEENMSWTILSYYPRICFDRLRKSTKMLVRITGVETDVRSRTSRIRTRNVNHRTARSSVCLNVNKTWWSFRQQTRKQAYMSLTLLYAAFILLKILLGPPGLADCVEVCASGAGTSVRTMNPTSSSIM